MLKLVPRVLNDTKLSHDILKKIEDVVKVCSNGKYSDVWNPGSLWFLFYKANPDIDLTSEEGILEEKEKHTGEIIGCFRITPHTKKRFIISHVAVMPVYRHQKVGTFMFQFLEKYIKVTNWRPHMVLGVDKHNMPAIFLYKKSGYKISGELEDMYMFERQY